MRYSHGVIFVRDDRLADTSIPIIIYLNVFKQVSILHRYVYKSIAPLYDGGIISIVMSIIVVRTPSTLVV